MGQPDGASPESGWPAELKRPTDDELASRRTEWAKFADTTVNAFINLISRSLDGQMKMALEFNALFDWMLANRTALFESGLYLPLMEHINRLMEQSTDTLRAFTDLHEVVTEAHKRAQGR